MAFEQNQRLQQLLSPNQNLPQQYQQQQPSFGMAPIQQQNGGFWNNLKQFALGSPAQFAYSSPYGQNQMQGFQRLLQMGLQNQQNPYEGFEPLQQHIMDQYYGKILPRLNEQFGSTGGAASSPAFAKQLRGGAQGLASMLAAHQAQYGQQNKELGLRQAQLGLTPQYDNSYVPREPGALEDVYGLGKQLASNAIPFGLRYLMGAF